MDAVLMKLLPHSTLFRVPIQGVVASHCRHLVKPDDESYATPFQLA